MQYYSCKENWNAIILNLWSLTKHVLYFSFFFLAAANYSKVSSCGEGRPRKWWIWQGKNVNFDKLGFFVIYSLELINNSWSLNEGNYELDSVWISAPLRSHRFWLFYFSVFFLVLVSINRENISNTLDSVSKHLEIRQKYGALRCIFNCLLGVWKCGQHDLSCLIYCNENPDNWKPLSF